MYETGIVVVTELVVVLIILLGAGVIVQVLAQ
jgi:hypothetical protein